MRFQALVAEQHQVIFGGKEQIVGKKQHIQCEKAFVILQSWWVSKAVGYLSGRLLRLIKQLYHSYY